jgi:hypothetical protein
MPFAAHLLAVLVDGRLWTGVGQLALRNNVVVEVSASRHLGACVVGGSAPRSVERQALRGCMHRKALALAPMRLQARPALGYVSISTPQLRTTLRPRVRVRRTSGEPAWQLRGCCFLAAAVWLADALQRVASGAACSHPPAWCASLQPSYPQYGQWLDVYLIRLGPPLPLPVAGLLGSTYRP